MKTCSKMSPLLYFQRTLQIITAIILIAYPFAIYFGLNYWGIQTIAPILIVLFLLRLSLAKGKIKQLSWLIKIIAIVGITLSSASWALKQTQWLLFYPVLVNLVLFLVFSYSIVKPPTIIERLARMTEPNLPPSGVIYTQKITKIWCAFFLLNGSIALFTCLYGNMDIWTLYNGAISYVLIGLLMGIEWIVRQKIRHHDDT